MSAIFVFQLGAKCANPEVPSPPEDPADPDIDDEFIVVETSRRLTDSGQLFGTPPSRLSSLSPQPAIFASLWLPIVVQVRGAMVATPNAPCDGRGRT